MLSKKQLQDAAMCGEGKMSCRVCNLNNQKLISGRIFGPETTIKDTGCFNQLAKTALEYREGLEKAKTTIKTLIAYNELSKIADIQGEEMVAEIDKLLGEREG